MSARNLPNEQQVEAACDRAVRAVHGDVVLIGRGRSDGQQSPGIPSRRYYVNGHVFWWAPRAKRGRLSGATAAFMQAEHSYGHIVGAGDDEDLREVIRATTSPGTVTAVRSLAWHFARAVMNRSGCAGETTCTESRL